MRISSPPVTHPCFYGIDTDSQDQLIAARLDERAIAAHLGVDSLGYLSREGMVTCARAEASQFCTACFDGRYPIPVEEGLKASKLMLEPAALSAGATPAAAAPPG
jgi:amidophosphoribosyltransferase